MPQTQIACPRCRQMIAANIEQLFDVTQAPQAKHRLLGRVRNNIGAATFIHGLIKLRCFQRRVNLRVYKNEK